MPLLLALVACTLPEDPPGNSGGDSASDADTYDASDAPTGDTGFVVPGLPKGLRARPHAPCGPKGATRFVEVGGGDFADYPWLDQSAGVNIGAGLGVADFDGDGRIDIAIPGKLGMEIYRNITPPGDSEPVFERDTQRALGSWAADLVKGVGAVPVDIDADGDLDLFLTRGAETNQIAINDGSGVFSAGRDKQITADLQARSVGASFADIDLDGDLDVFVAGYGALTVPKVGDPSQLLRNEGTRFVDITSTLPSTLADSYSFVGGWADVDGDLYPEMYLVNDFGWRGPNVLFHNAQGTLRPDSGDAGLDLALECMGLAMGDINGDEVPDYVVTAWDAVRVMLSEPSGSLWFDFSANLGVSHDHATDRHVAWGTELADLDNDGDLDLYVAFGKLKVNKANPDQQPDAVFENVGTQASPSFEQVAEKWGLAAGDATRAALLVDLNNDGALDVVRRNTTGPSRLYTGRCGAGNWLRLALEQETANPRAIGAKVRVRYDVDGDEVSAVRWLQAGSTNFAAGGPPEVHFGVGQAAFVDIDVLWPDGHETTWKHVPTNHILVGRR